jgi:hypothetical protein
LEDDPSRQEKRQVDHQAKSKERSEDQRVDHRVDNLGDRQENHQEDPQVLLDIQEDRQMGHHAFLVDRRLTHIGPRNHNEGHLFHRMEDLLGAEALLMEEEDLRVPQDTGEECHGRHMDRRGIIHPGHICHLHLRYNPLTAIERPCLEKPNSIHGNPSLFQARNAQNGKDSWRNV